MRLKKIHLPHIDIPVSLVLAVVSMLATAELLREFFAR
jgi:hypothetical protein